jgi:transposase InsO family protein
MEGGSVMKADRQFTQKQKLAILESARGIGIKKASDLAGVHYTTIYEWRRKLEAVGKDAFLAYRAPSRGRGIKRITAEQERAVLETWHRFKGFGPSQVRNQLRRQGITISTRSVQRIMKANGYEGIRNKPKEKTSVRFEASRPLELVQIDIVEFFIHKLKVYLIILLDDFSRFILGYRLLEETSIDQVIQLVQQVMDRYGKMEEILSDRGFVFYSWRGANRFERFLEVEGIHHTHARAHHPQTLGKIEAANKQLQKELLRREQFASMAEALAALSQWVESFNYKRTHQGLGGFLVPADRFHGKVEQVLKSISEGLDPDGQSCYSLGGISRSLINLILEPEGGVFLYILGRPIKLFGGGHE